MSDAPSLLEQASALCASGHPEEALPLFTAAAKRTPDDASLLCNWAGACFMARRMDDAGPLYERALALDPSLEEAHYGRIRVLIAQRKWTDALDHLTASKPNAEHPRTPEWHYLRGITHEGMGRPDDALNDFLAAYNRDYGPVQMPLVRLLVHMNRPDHALRISLTGSPSPKNNYPLVDACLRHSPHPTHLNEATRHYLEHSQYAYALRIASRAHRLFPGLRSSDYPALKECSWF